ncbi:MAG: NADH-quinone oxidoreductase subunit C [Myxococcota bacterium]
MTPKDIFERLQTKFPDAISAYTEGEGVKDAFCKAAAARIVEIMTFLRDDPQSRFDFLQSLSGVDNKEVLTTVYHLWSYPHRHSFVVKCDVPRDEPVCPSVAGVWSTADWLERESYDLLGIRYSGHPDLRRIMLPDDWEGHPLRKDYKEKDAYRGMPTTRYSPLELLPIYDAHAVEQLKQGGAPATPPAETK